MRERAFFKVIYRVYEDLTDCLEIWPEDSQDIEQKNRVRDFRCLKLISRNGLRRKTYRKRILKQPIGISKKPHTVLKINAL